MLGDRIRERRTELGMSQEQLANKIGYKSRSTINKIELGINDVNQSTLVKFANALNTSVANLLGWDGNVESVSLDDKMSIPVLGRVAAGYNKQAQQDKIGELQIDKKNGDYIGLVIRGDSMEPTMHENDIVIVQMDCEYKTGDYVIAVNNGNDATCKRLQMYAESLMLIPSNTAYEPKVYSKEQVEEYAIKILGKVVELRRQF